VAVFVFVVVAIVALVAVEPVVVHFGLECCEYVAVDSYTVHVDLVVVAVDSMIALALYQVAVAVVLLISQNLYCPMNFSGMVVQEPKPLIIHT